MLNKSLQTCAAAAALTLIGAPAAAAQGSGVLLSGYAAPGVSEQNILGGSGPKRSSSAAARATVANDLVAKAAAQGVPTQRGAAPVPVPSSRPAASTRPQAPAHRAAKHAATGAPAASANAEQGSAPAAVLAAAARPPGPGDGLGSIWIFGGAVVALAAASAALWRRGAR